MPACLVVAFVLQPHPLYGTERGAADNRATVIPSELCQGLWIVPVTFVGDPGKTLRFILDTGAEQASLKYVFNTLDWDGVIHVMLPGNAASIAVARKIGSEFLGTQQGLAAVTDETIEIYGHDAPAR